MSDEFPRKRRRWGWWALGTLGVLILITAAIPPILKRGQARQIDARMQRYRAAGEPVVYTDLDTRPVADQDNAVIELREAAAEVARRTNANPDWQLYRQDGPHLPLTRREGEVVGRILAATPKALPLIDAAMKKPGFYWNNHPITPLLSWTLPDLTPMRELSRWLTAATLSNAASGDAKAVVRDVERHLFLARALEAHPRVLIVSLLIAGIHAGVCDDVLAAAPTLRVGAGPMDAEPSAVRRVIDALLDDKPLVDNFVSGIHSERVLIVDIADAVMSGNVPITNVLANQNTTTADAILSPAGRYLGGSMVLADTILILDADTATADACRLTDLPAALAKVGSYDAPLTQDPMRHFWARTLLPNLRRPLEVLFRERTHRHLAATALAVRWYACEHDGRLPKTLAELVPKYLQAVPTDLLAAGAPPLRYLPADPDPRVYSIGTNAIDDHGSDKVMGSAGTGSLWDRADAVVHLRGSPRDLSRVPVELKD